MRSLLIIVALSISHTFFSQASSDSMRVFTFEDYIGMVRTYHPIMRIASIQAEKGDAELMTAKGGFDPILRGKLDQKYFDDKSYYSLLDAGLTVPTWFGIKGEVGYEQNDGINLNDQNLTPDDGLWYAGISIPLGKGLFIDQRRADLKMAKIYQQSSRLEQVIMANELLMDAVSAYWTWFESYNRRELFQTMRNNASIRLNAVKGRNSSGDLAAIDTLEAFIQLQNRDVQLQEAQLEFLNAGAILSTYLWSKDYAPLEVDSSFIPDIYQSLEASLPEGNEVLVIDSLGANHPELLAYSNDIDIQRIKIRLSREALKPSVDLKYNALNGAGQGGVFNDYSIENYKWGASVKFPLFLRKERGKLKYSELVLEEKSMGMANKQQTLVSKANIALNTWLITANQFELARLTADNYLRLLEAERTLFKKGESSLFMINSREKSYIESQEKLLKVIAKNAQGSSYFYYALGALK